MTERKKVDCKKAAQSGADEGKRQGEVRRGEMGERGRGKEQRAEQGVKLHEGIKTYAER